jgi:hypothetical protein
MTWLVLWHTALPLVAGLLCGRHLRRRRLDQVERDAWEDGFHACLDAVTGLEDDEDEMSGQVQATQQQAVPGGWPGWN